MFVQVLVLVAATHSATPCGDVYSPHQQWGSALSAIQESTFVRFPSPAPVFRARPHQHSPSCTLTYTPLHWLFVLLKI